jgi:AcrR family transcriptional regulator
MRNADRRENSREATLAAAMELLEQVGYSRLRTADVAKRSGMSEGTLFHYFPTKHELVAAAAERALDQLLQRAVVQVSEVADPTDPRSLAKVLWDVLSDKSTTWLHELFAANQADAELKRVLGPVIEASGNAIDEVGLAVIKSIGRVPDDECRTAVDVVIWSIQGLVARDMARGESGLENELLDYLAFLFDSLYPVRTTVGANASVTTAGIP